DDVETTTGYTATDPACQSRYIVGAANSMEQRANGTVLRHRESTVDCTTGTVNQVRATLVAGSIAVTDLEYFDNGNLKSVTGPSNQTGQRYRLEYGYDTVAAVHVESIVDSFGYRSSSTHNMKF